MDLLFWVMNPPILGKSRCEVGFTSRITNTIRKSRRNSNDDPHVSRTGDVPTKMSGNLELPESGDTKGQKCAEVAILILTLPSHLLVQGRMKPTVLAVAQTGYLVLTDIQNNQRTILKTTFLFQ